ncbi:MAG: hypothetical protein AAFU61_00075 [Pseudomonadota bacterium]
MTPEQLLSAADRADGLSDPSVALNLTGVSDWGTQMPFIDIAKTMRPLFGHEPGQWGGMSHEELVEGGFLDAQGWPTAIPEGLEKIGTIWAWGDTPLAAEDRKGVYVLTYEGEGEIELGLGARVLSREPGRIVFENTSGGSMVMNITVTDPNGTSDHIRDISIVHEDHLELHEAGALFNPDWLEKVEDFRQFRFMDWMKTNNSTQSEWAGRPKVEDASWIADGVPVEIMVRLANEAGVDPWFTMPHGATEEYIREFATYVRDHLDPGLVASVEFSNEAWNWAFRHTHEINALREADWGTGWPQEYYGKLATEMALIWDDVFGAEADARLVKVLGGQTVNDWATGVMMEAETWHRLEPDTARKPAEVFDALAVTTYFGGAASTNADKRQALIEAIEDPGINAFEYLAARLRDPEFSASLPYISREWLEQKALADANGLDLIAYEGGQHVHHLFATDGEGEVLSDFMAEFVRSPQMAELYAESMAGWAEIGDGPYIQFGDVGASSKWGSWSLWEHLNDEVPRADVVVEANAQPATWEERGGEHFQQGVTEQGGEGDHTLVGTRLTDWLLGGEGDDTLVGGDGDDGLHGGAGRDVALVSGRAEDYRIEVEDGAIRLTGPDGTDRLVRVEILRFSEGGEIDLEALHPELFVEPAPLPEPGTTPASAPAPSTPSQPAGLPAPEPHETRLIADVAEATVHDPGDRGMIVAALNRWSSTAEELGVAEQRPGYVAYQSGITAEFGGQTIAANYWSLNDNRAERDGDLLSASAVDTALAFGDVLVGVGRIIGTAQNDSFLGRDGDDGFFGAAGDDSFHGAGGNDTLDGGEGDDLFDGGEGDDVIDGGAGFDVARFSGSASDYVFAAGSEGIRVSGPDGSDLLIDVERLEFADGSWIEATLNAPEAAPRTMLAEARGGATVSLAALPDGDMAAAGFSAEAGEATEEPAPETGTVTSEVPSISFAFGGWSGTPKLATGATGLDISVQGETGAHLVGNALGNTLVGGDGNDRVEGEGGDDTLDGGDGDDSLEGGAGADTLIGGQGDDLIDGGTGEDVALFAGALADHAVFTDGDDVIVEGAEGRDRLTGVERLTFADVDIETAALFGPQVLDMGQVGRVQIAAGASSAEIALARDFENPVAFAFRLTGEGPEAAMVQVEAAGDALSLALVDPMQGGWADAGHGAQDIAWAVFEAGDWELADGTRLSVGETRVDPADGAARIDFGEAGFDAGPALITQAQGLGGDWAVVRAENEDAAGVELSLHSAEAAPRAAAAQVGWFAIEEGTGDWDGVTFEAGDVDGARQDAADAAFEAGFDAAPALLASIATLAGPDPAAAALEAVSAQGASLFAAEERTRDEEVRHASETIDFFAFEGEGLLSALEVEPAPAVLPDGRQVVAQIGEAVLDHEETTLSLAHAFENPVAFALAPTLNGGHPVVAEIVAAEGAELTLRLREPEAYDGWHVTETTTWMVVEAGAWRMEDGARLEAGVTGGVDGVSDGFDRIDFSEGFDAAPVVLGQIQSLDEDVWAVSRQRGADAGGFEAAVQRQEAAGADAPTAELGWLAMEAGTGEWDGIAWQAASTEARFDDGGDRFEFAEGFETAPLALAALSSMNGGDPAALRRTEIDAGGLGLVAMEETSADGETWHVAEEVDLLAFAESGLLYGSAWDLSA